MRATMCALESIVMDPFEPGPARLAAGKLRLCIQASIRHDDLTNTPLAACEWVRKPGESRIVGLRSRATRGKAGPRLWVASLRGASPEGDGWLSCLMKLVLAAHGASWRADDHFGKDCDKDRTGFTCFPPTLESDVILVKEALTSFVKGGRVCGLSEDDISTLRWHGAKATMASVMQHLGIKPLAVRFQGAWASQSDTMPDTYLREAQTMVLEAQEKCLSYLRGGGDLVRLLGTPIGEGEAVPPEEYKEAARRAMASPACFAADESSLPLEFFDQAFTDDGWDGRALGAEAAGLSARGHPSREELVLEAPAPEPDAVSDADSEASTERQLPETSEADPLDWMDRADTEGMVSRFVQVASPTTKSRLHLPALSRDGGDYPVEAEPKCGAGGKFAYLKADEAIDPSGGLCQRCWPLSGHGSCPVLCEHMTLTKKAVVLRCSRRCSHNPGSHDSHHCAVHAAEADA